MISLLNKMNMTDHILYEDNVTNFISSSAYNNIDNENLKTLVADSRDYLKRMLDNSNKKNAQYSY